MPVYGPFTCFLATSQNIEGENPQITFVIVLHIFKRSASPASVHQLIQSFS
jgi:hypothetical protein